MKTKVISNLIFWCSIISLPISFSLCGIIGEPEIFGVGGIVRYSWIMLLFTPITLTSLILGFYLKKQKLKYKKNIYVSIICLPLLLIFGSYRFIFNSIISYDDSQIIEVEDKIEFDLPNELKLVTINYEDECVITYAKITNENAKKDFEENVSKSNLWTNSLSTKMSGILPYYIQIETTNFDYFLFFNETSESYSQTSFFEGEYKLVFVAYDLENGKLIVLNNYIMNIVN